MVVVVITVLVLWNSHLPNVSMTFRLSCIFRSFSGRDKTFLAAYKCTRLCMMSMRMK